MDRNLDRRVEAMVPVEDGEARSRIAEIIEIMLEDDRRSWQLGPDAAWRRTEEIQGQPGTCDTHEELKAPGAAPRPRPRRRRTGRGPASARWIRAREATMTATRRERQPIEIELKYRVVDAAAGDRYLAADEIAGFRPTLAGPLDPGRGPLHRHRRRGDGPGRVRRPAAPDGQDDDRRGQVVGAARSGPATSIAARSSRARPTGPPIRATGRRPMPAR